MLAGGPADLLAAAGLAGCVLLEEAPKIACSARRAAAAKGSSACFKVVPPAVLDANSEASELSVEGTMFVAGDLMVDNKLDESTSNLSLPPKACATSFPSRDAASDASDDCTALRLPSSSLMTGLMKLGGGISARAGEGARTGPGGGRGGKPPGDGSGAKAADGEPKIKASFVDFKAPAATSSPGAGLARLQSDSVGFLPAAARRLPRLPCADNAFAE